jgi:hypothetical protein
MKRMSPLDAMSKCSSSTQIGRKACGGAVRTTWRYRRRTRQFRRDQLDEVIVGRSRALEHGEHPSMHGNVMMLGEVRPRGDDGPGRVDQGRVD